MTVERGMGNKSNAGFWTLLKPTGAMRNKKEDEIGQPVTIEE